MISSISNRNTSSTPSWDSPSWEIVKEWNLGEEKIVRFLRSEDRFWTLSKIGTNVPVGEPFELPEETEPMSPEEIIADVSTRQPYINDTGTVDFLRKFKSKLNDVTITEREWGVTLVDLGPCILDGSRSDSSYSWGGHTVIIVEMVDDDMTYRMWRGDATIGINGLVKVKCGETSFDSLEKKKKNFSKTETWVRTKSFVKKMMNQIDLEAARSDKKKPIGFINGQPILFSLNGGESFSEKFRNCTTWARERAFLADIYIPFRPSFNVFQIPKLYINPSILTRAIHEATGLVFRSIPFIPDVWKDWKGDSVLCFGIAVMMRGTAAGLSHVFKTHDEELRSLRQFAETIQNENLIKQDVSFLTDLIEKFLKKHKDHFSATVVSEIQVKVDSLKKILKFVYLKTILRTQEKLVKYIEKTVVSEIRFKVFFLKEILESGYLETICQTLEAYRTISRDFEKKTTRRNAKSRTYGEAIDVGLKAHIFSATVDLMYKCFYVKKAAQWREELAQLPQTKQAPEILQSEKKKFEDFLVQSIIVLQGGNDEQVSSDLAPLI